MQMIDANMFQRFWKFNPWGSGIEVKFFDLLCLGLIRTELCFVAFVEPAHWKEKLLKKNSFKNTCRSAYVLVIEFDKTRCSFGLSEVRSTG